MESSEHPYSSLSLRALDGLSYNCLSLHIFYTFIMFSRLFVPILLASTFVYGAPVQSTESSALAKRTTYSGDGTWYYPGLGACGEKNTNSDLIVAVSYLFYNSYPGATANPNDNPICNKEISITYGGVTATAKITDKCMGCAGEDDLDMSPALFEKFAAESVGRIYGVKWSFV